MRFHAVCLLRSSNATISRRERRRSTKLIHGGVRYLEQAFKSMDLSLIELVTEALEERSFMLDSMPFMAKPLPIMLPCYSWWEIPFYFAGMKVHGS